MSEVTAGLISNIGPCTERKHKHYAPPGFSENSGFYDHHEFRQKTEKRPDLQTAYYCIFCLTEVIL